VSNALGHDTDLAFDYRFGAARSVTDPINRTTSIVYDNFGRESSRTTPDGVVITTTYQRCGVDVSCSVVVGITPATRVSTSSPVTPTRR